ncbi:hypothetical protein BJX96DRAFT_148888 [Aspergillus floccosus]
MFNVPFYESCVSSALLPNQNDACLPSISIITGARTSAQIRATIMAGFMPMSQISWTTSLLALTFAQSRRSY